MAEITFGEAKIQAVAETMRADDRVVIIGGGGFTGLHYQELVKPLHEEFRDRILRMPIAELGFVGLSIGAAIGGLRPIVTIGTGTFAFEAWPQIVNEAPVIYYMTGGQTKVPVMGHALVGMRGGGAAQHSARPQAMLKQAPGLQIIAPAVASDVKGLVQDALDSERPTFWIDHVLLIPEKWPVPDGAPRLPLGKARVVRPGRDVTIVGYSIDLVRSLKAAEELAKEGIDAEVVDLRTLAPLDRETVLSSVAKTGRLVVVDECSPSCSVSAEIAAIVAEEGLSSLKRPVKRVNFANTPVPASPPLERFLTPTVEKVVAAAKALM
jgi:pyruvate dehydrogenase E1 component beta subunit